MNTPNDGQQSQRSVSHVNAPDCCDEFLRSRDGVAGPRKAKTLPLSASLWKPRVGIGFSHQKHEAKQNKTCVYVERGGGREGSPSKRHNERTISSIFFRPSNIDQIDTLRHARDANLLLSNFPFITMIVVSQLPIYNNTPFT